MAAHNEVPGLGEAPLMNRFVLGICFAAVCSLYFPAGVQAEDWPQWRGPNRDDVSTETGLLQQWPEGGPEKLWTSDKGGLGYAGFSVVGDELFTMGLEDDKEFVVCMDANDGSVKWSTVIADRFENNWGDGPRSTPAVDGNFVYAMSGRGTLACLRRQSGEIAWSREMQDLGGETPFWGYAESPLVDGNKVICTPGGDQGTLAALNKANGEVIWRSTDLTDPAHYASTISATINGTEQYIQLTPSTLVGVNARTGDVIWKQEWPGKTAVIPTPIYSDGSVYVSSGYGVGCMKIDIGPDNTVTEEFTNKVMRNHHGGVILVDGNYYGYSDSVGWVCQDGETGEVTWREKGELGKGAIAYADNRFYLQDEETGEVVLIEASTEGWSEKGRFKIEPQTERRKPAGKIWVHPVIANGKLYLRDQEIICCYDISR